MYSSSYLSVVTTHILVQNVSSMLPIGKYPCQVISDIFSSFVCLSVL